MSELVRARATLQRGAVMFATWLDWPDVPADRSIPHALRSKVIANGLRELDRFLNILIDEASRRRGLSPAAHQRNTANKLRGFKAAVGLRCDDYHRLLALGKSRECLFHCGGVASRGDADDPGMMTLGWPAVAGEDGPLRRVATRAAITLDRSDLRGIGHFYTRLGDALAAEDPSLFAGRSGLVTSSSRPYIDCIAPLRS